MGLGWILLITIAALLLVIVASCWYFSWLMQKWRIKWVQKMNTEQIKSRY